jgi:hypothetical protein
MWDKIARFIDYDENRMSHEQIREEFNHKYANSWVLINGEPTQVIILKNRNDGNAELWITNTKGEATKLPKLLTIARFTPKTGLYSNSKYLLYLYRIPNRQWTKGFALGANYASHLLESPDKFEDKDLLELILNPETIYSPESVIFKNNIYLHWKKIGTYNEMTQRLHLKDDHFKKEIEEIWKPYKVTLDQLPQKNAMEEKLMLDF